jgi:hypothetical protein
MMYAQGQYHNLGHHAHQSMDFGVNSFVNPTFLESHSPATHHQSLVQPSPSPFDPQQPNA